MVFPAPPSPTISIIIGSLPKRYLKVVKMFPIVRNFISCKFVKSSFKTKPKLLRTSQNELKQVKPLRVLHILMKFCRVVNLTTVDNRKKADLKVFIRVIVYGAEGYLGYALFITLLYLHPRYDFVKK